MGFFICTLVVFIMDSVNHRVIKGLSCLLDPKLWSLIAWKKCLTHDYTNTTQHSPEEMQQTQLPSFRKRCWLKPNCYFIIFFFKESKQHVTAREITFSIKKKEEGPYWPKLLKDKKKVGFLFCNTNLDVLSLFARGKICQGYYYN